MCGCPYSHRSLMWHGFYALFSTSVQQGFWHACCVWQLSAERLSPAFVVSSLSQPQRSYYHTRNTYLQLTIVTFTEWVTVCSDRESLHWFFFFPICCCPSSPVEVIWANNLCFNFSTEKHNIIKFVLKVPSGPEINILLIICMVWSHILAGGIFEPARNSKS